MGGSFDPIHSAHIAAAQEAIDQLDLNWVYLVPAGAPYHREETVASAQQRMTMTALAIEGDSRLRVSDVDLVRSGNTYTIDTVCDLQNQFAESNPADTAEWYLILGADAYAGFARWRDPEEIVNRTNLIVITRPGTDLEEMVEFPAKVIRVTGWDISSTEIRNKLAEGKPVDGLLPAVVIEYIRDNDVYSPTKRK